MFAQFARWFQPSSTIHQAHALYIALVGQARQPFFYEKLQVPDTLDGRFDMIVLHVFLITQRLKPRHRELANQIIDVMMDDMDRSLREVGVGDMSVGKKVKHMADALNGRMQIYGEAIEDDAALRDALTRNVYRGQEVNEANISAISHYVQQAHKTLTTQSDDMIEQADIVWPVLT